MNAIAVPPSIPGIPLRIELLAGAPQVAPGRLAEVGFGMGTYHVSAKKMTIAMDKRYK
jgi:hypothetical protein